METWIYVSANLRWLAQRDWTRDFWFLFTFANLQARMEMELRCSSHVRGWKRELKR